MGTATGEAAWLQTIEHHVPAEATAGNDSEVVLGTVKYTGAVSLVTYATDTAITGANTNTRSVNLYNRKGDGSGVTLIATLEFDSGVNTTQYAPKTITLQAAANLNVSAGDVLSWKSTHVGTGITDPGGLAHVEITRD